MMSDDAGVTAQNTRRCGLRDERARLLHRRSFEGQVSARAGGVEHK